MMDQENTIVINDLIGAEDKNNAHFANQSVEQVLSQRKRVLFTSLSLIVLCLIIAFFLPVPYVAEEPGETVDVLGSISPQQRIITITGAKTYEHPGQLRMTSVSLYTNMTLLAILGKWLSSGAEILPQAMIIPPNQSNSQMNHEVHTMFTHSENNAAMAALHYLHLDYKKVHVVVDLPGIGGPSAGLIFTLGIISRLSSHDFLHGRIIAGTGEITSDGKVGEIGGITMKLAAAKRDGAQYFLVPAGNCAEAMTEVPTGLTIIKVSSVDDAMSALNALNSGGHFHGCTA